jgi:hypothetical protein
VLRFVDWNTGISLSEPFIASMFIVEDGCKNLFDPLVHIDRNRRRLVLEDRNICINHGEKVVCDMLALFILGI